MLSLFHRKQTTKLKGEIMKLSVIKTIQVLLTLAFMTIGFVFVGAFVEYKILNGANIFAGLTFATILYFVISAAAFITIKESIFN